MKIRVEWSIGKTEEEKARWPSDEEKCPRCGQPFGGWKKVRVNGEVIHKKCMVAGDKLGG